MVWRAVCVFVKSRLLIDNLQNEVSSQWFVWLRVFVLRQNNKLPSLFCITVFSLVSLSFNNKQFFVIIFFVNHIVRAGTHSQPRFDFQGGSLQLFRDSPRHTHRHTPCSELCEDNGGSSLINSSITLSLLCIASLLSCSCICERVSVLQQTREGWGLCGRLGQLQSRVTLICCVPDEERPTEDFPFTRCPPPSAFGPLLSVTLHSHVQIQLYSQSSCPLYVSSTVPEHLTNKNVSQLSVCLTFALQLADLFGAIPRPEWSCSFLSAAVFCRVGWSWCRSRISAWKWMSADEQKCGKKT